MRELVYLSERKLQQFRLGKRRRWNNRTPVEGEINFLGFGGVRFGPTPPGAGDAVTPDLESVISALEASDRAAMWFGDPAVQPGQWVYFEAPLCYAPLGLRDEPGAVVFIDHGEPTAGYPTGGQVRLLMHGSEAHVVGSATSPPVHPQLPDDPFPAVRFNDLSDFRTFAHLLTELNRRWAAADAGETDAVAALDERPFVRYLPELVTRSGHSYASIADVIRRNVFDLDSLVEPRLTASWLAGHARVSVQVPSQRRDEPRVVVATPLYVERVSPPADKQ
ncbi:SAVMC3_10250 family protein [Streptomyces sp. NPDC008343]|uniref:SAVMC3_10250 family protein n=1 Tax=Streptomyces sp. NPDC008343 TaxID=3364828 RepID=UPI0036E90376